MSEDHERKMQERALHNVRHLVDRLEGKDLAWGEEKMVLKWLVMLFFAMAGFVGIAMLVSGSKEKDLARHRCELDRQVALVWQETQSLKAARPELDAKAVTDQVNAKRSQFKDEARTFCAGK
jgi:hypothetical protein